VAQAPAPLQTPVVPQLDAGVDLHWPAGSGLPLGTGVVATPSIRRNSQGSRGSSVVVMETAEHRNRDDLAGGLSFTGPSGIRCPIP